MNINKVILVLITLSVIIQTSSTLEDMFVYNSIYFSLDNICKVCDPAKKKSTQVFTMSAFSKKDFFQKIRKIDWSNITNKVTEIKISTTIDINGLVLGDNEILLQTSKFEDIFDIISKDTNLGSIKRNRGEPLYMEIHFFSDEKVFIKQLIRKNIIKHTCLDETQHTSIILGTPSLTVDLEKKTITANDPRVVHNLVDQIFQLTPFVNDNNFGLFIETYESFINKHTKECGVLFQKTIKLYSGIVKTSLKYIKTIDNYIREVEELEKLWDITRLKLNNVREKNIQTNIFLKNKIIRKLTKKYKNRLNGSTYSRNKFNVFIDDFKLISVIGGEDTTRIKSRYAILLNRKLNNNIEIDYITEEFNTMAAYFCSCTDFILKFKANFSFESNIKEQKNTLTRIKDIISELVDGSEVNVEDLYISKLKRGIELADERDKIED